jgi:hypothetical protein
MLLPYYAILFGGFGGKFIHFYFRRKGWAHGTLGKLGSWDLALADQSDVIASMYMMSRMVLGHKTWFGKD